MATRVFKIKQTVEQVIEIPIEPCPKCGGTDITTADCGYSSFNVCSVTCKCGRKVELTGDYTEQQMIEAWNSVSGQKTDQEKMEILRRQLRRARVEPLV